MSRFFDRRKMSPKFKAALQALSELLQEEGYGAVEQVHGEVVGDYLEQTYAERYGLKRSGVTDNCLCRMVGKMCPWRFGRAEPCITLPMAMDGVHEHIDDHTSLWNKGSKPFVYIAQPYGLSLEGMRSIVQVCDAYGLDADIDGTSWHYPNSTILIEIHKQGWRKESSGNKE